MSSISKRPRNAWSTPPDGLHILTDAYAAAWDPLAFGDGTIPIRWIDRRTAWDRTCRQFAFNQYADSTRRVYVAEMSELIDGS